MAKIDLHIHTTGENREISNENLLNTLVEAGVELASITNHDEFSLENYNKLTENNLNIKFIPGLEVNVSLNGVEDYKHIILYGNNGEKFNEIFLEIKLKYKNGKIEWDDLIKILNIKNEEILMSFHYLKDGKRSFEIEEINKCVLGLNPTIKTMLELPNLKCATSNWDDIAKKIKMHISAFSDVTNWSEYVKNAEQLPEISLNIKTLEEYIHHLVYSNENIFTFLEPKPEAFSYKIRSEEVLNVDLLPGLNLVFGAKGSGKSEFINAVDQQNDRFTKLTFSDSNKINGLSKLYDFLNDSMLLKAGEVDKMAILSDKLNAVRKPIINKEVTNFDGKVYVQNIKNWKSFGKINEINKKVSLFKEEHIMNREGKYENFEEINSKLEEIIEIILKDNYNSNVDTQEIKKLIKINLEDWKNAMHIDLYTFKNEWQKKIKDVFKNASKPKVGLEKIVSNLSGNVSEIINIMKDQISFPFDSIKIFESDDLSGGYTFNYQLVERKNLSSSQDDYKKVNTPNAEGSKIAKSFIYLDLNKMLEFDKNDQFKFSDIYNVIFTSKLGTGEDEKYIPSSGELDTLKLMFHLKGENNLIIDEFCNTLDGKFVYEAIVPIINNNRKIILATTHNPILAIVPKVSKYIYTEKKDERYYKYETNESIFHDLKATLQDVDKVYNVKEKLMEVMEGTRKAFNIRKGKYES